MKRLFLLLTSLLVPSLASENELMNGASSEVSGEAVQQPSYEVLSQGSLQAPSVDAALPPPTPLSIAEPTDVPGKESPPVSQQQLVPSEYPPFIGFPKELVLKILKQVSCQNSSACHAWEHLISTFRATAKLGRFLADVNEIEGSFESVEKRDKELTRRIVADYNEIKKDQEAQTRCTESESPESLTRIQDKLEKNRLIKMLPTLSSHHSDNHVCGILMAAGNFVGLPLVVRRIIAKRIWPARGCTNPNIGSLFYFLSLYDEYIGGFKNALVHVDPEVVTEACFKILFDIDSARRSVERLKKLLASIGSLFPEDSLPAMACSLCDVLSSESPMTKILEVMKPMDARLVTIMTAVLQSSPKYVTANWCVTKLGRSPFLLILDDSNLHYHLLFSDEFRDKHDISDVDQSLLLESCTPEDLLMHLPSGLTSLDTQALFEWTNGVVDLSKFAFSYAVTLYSLDDDDQNALLMYFPSQRDMDWLAFATIALELNYAQRLSDKKRDALLKHLFPERASTFDVNDEKHRKTLIVQVMSSFKGPLSDAFVCGLSGGNFKLCVETWLDDPEGCRMPAQLDDERKDLAARKLVKSIGDDVNKVANLQKLPMYYQVMVFLLTDCDAVADLLSESLDKAQVMLHFVDYWHRWGFRDHKEGSRAARRARALCQPLLTELGIA